MRIDSLLIRYAANEAMFRRETPSTLEGFPDTKTVNVDSIGLSLPEGPQN